MSAPADGEFLLVAQELLDCAALALDTTAAGRPPRICLYPGAEPTWDACDCGMLALHVPRNYPSDRFPDQKVAPPFKPGAGCSIPFTVVEYVVTVLRCVPGNDNDRPPSCDRLNASMATQLDDRQAVLWGVQCCLESRTHMISDQLAVGEQGGCAGSELHVFVAFSNCKPCPDGFF